MNKKDYVLFGINFLDKNERIGEKVYYYKVSNKFFEEIKVQYPEILGSDSEKEKHYYSFNDNTYSICRRSSFNIVNENDYAYRNSEVIITQIIIDEEIIDSVESDCMDRVYFYLKDIKPAGSISKEYSRYIYLNKITENNEPNEENIDMKGTKGENMFEKMFKGFEFGKATDVVLSVKGPAFATATGEYIARDNETDSYIEVTGLIFDENESFCYKIPVSKRDVKVGDYILHNFAWVRVLEVLADGGLYVENPFIKERAEIVPTKNIFGFDFYTKLVCLTENIITNSVSEDNPFGNMLPLMMLMNKDSDKDKLLPLLMLSGNSDSLFGNNTNMNPMVLYMMMSDSKDMKDILPLFLLSGMNKS